MKLTFLGTGTSTGVPQIRCRCATCESTDPRDKRLRASALVTLDNGQALLIDCSPDFRTQILAAGSPDIHAVLLTHVHFDHVGGIDDLRPYCYPDPLPIYCQPRVADDIRSRLPYCFVENPYPGVPTFEMHEIDETKPFTVGDTVVTPLPVMHFKLPIVGYRIGRLAYVTDCLVMPESTKSLIRGVDTLVINALRRTPHMSHMDLDQALNLIAELRPREAYLIHMSHQMGRHADVEPLLPQNVKLAYDGLTINIPND